MMNKSVLAGGVLPFTPKSSELVFDSLREMLGTKAGKLPAVGDDDLREITPAFTMARLTLLRFAGIISAK